jgi:3-hydroxyisobutyrate dehydrogenase-like beta-hydroxyacid dehydrogenase
MSEVTKPVIGFIGLGIMGGAMALNLQKAGYELIIHDVRREVGERHLAQGAAWAASPREVTERSDAIFSCLPSLAAIESVALGPEGILAGARAGQAYFEMSTNTPALLRRLHAAFAERGVHLLDAPISGGALGAERGRLGIWVGGDKAAFDRFEPVLRAMGDRPIHVGAVGAGIVTKLVHNCTSQATQAAITEVFVLGVKAGADPAALWEAVRQGSIGRRRTFDGLIDEVLPASFDPPHATLRIILKDMLIATELGRELGVPMRISNLALADIQEGITRGWAERDCRSVTMLPQERAGVAIKVDPATIQEILERDPTAPTDTKRGL